MNFPPGVFNTLGDLGLFIMILMILLLLIYWICKGEKRSKSA